MAQAEASGYSIINIENSSLETYRGYKSIQKLRGSDKADTKLQIEEKYQHIYSGEYRGAPSVKGRKRSRRQAHAGVF